MTQAVVLIPGFFGFDHLGNDTYFADRFISGLGVVLNAPKGERYRVVAVPTIGIGTLAERQTALIGYLKKIKCGLFCQGEEPISKWHLVGHSTGANDAAFLTRTQRLRIGESGRSEFDPIKPPERPVNIASVTSIAAAFYGSTLTLSDIALLSEGEPRGILGIARGVAGAVEGFVNAFHGGFNSKLWFTLGAFTGRNQASFFMHLLGADGLGLDLHPNVVSRLTDTRNTTNVPHFSIATFAPPPPPPPDTSVDPLFRQLWTLADAVAKSRANADDLFPPPPFQMPDDERIIRSPGQARPVVDDGSNDAVVNTNRQVFRGENGKLAGLVVCDHADVLGQYRRLDLTDGKPIVDGLLTCGAHFRDPEFFALIRLVAEGILAS